MYACANVWKWGRMADPPWVVLTLWAVVQHASALIAPKHPASFSSSAYSSQTKHRRAMYVVWSLLSKNKAVNISWVSPPPLQSVLWNGSVLYDSLYDPDLDWWTWHVRQVDLSSPLLSSNWAMHNRAQPSTPWSGITPPICKAVLHRVGLTCSVAFGCLLLPAPLSVLQKPLSYPTNIALTLKLLWLLSRKPLPAHQVVVVKPRVCNPPRTQERMKATGLWACCSGGLGLRVTATVQAAAGYFLFGVADV